MKFLRKLFKRGGKSSEDLVEEARRRLWEELVLDAELLERTLKVDSLFSCPEVAISLSIGIAMSHDVQPYEYLKKLLESAGIEFTERWQLIARSATIQYRMGLFTKRLFDLSVDQLDVNIPMNDITYGVCVDRTVTELHDELLQINGLLDGMKAPGCGHFIGGDGRPIMAGDTGYRGSILASSIMEEHLKREADTKEDEDDEPA